MADPSLCEKCGRCCYGKLIIDGEVVYTPLPCPYLDEETRLCTVYAERHAVNPQCLPVEMGVKLGLFPPECPYVRGVPDYVPPRMQLTPQEVEACSEIVLGSRDDGVAPPAPDGEPRPDSQGTVDS